MRSKEQHPDHTPGGARLSHGSKAALLGLLLMGVGSAALAQSAPPAPTTPPKRLSVTDIMTVVLEHKPAIAECVNAQRKQAPEVNGKVVMRWTIQTNGHTKNVTCRSKETCSTYVADCLKKEIQQWIFPAHSEQGEPIDFPFTF